MKKLALVTVLMLSASPMALAQSTTPGQQPSPNLVRPGATTEGQEPSPNAVKPGATTEGQQPSPNAVNANAPAWYGHQANEIRASKLIGSSVKNNANETIGTINEVILDNNGKAAAVVIGVGGFLGMGEREVAMNFASLKLTHDSNGKTLIMADATKDSLKAAPEWTWSSSDRSKTTGTSK